jgi:TrmH family RNA methyltransferase
MDAAYNRSLLTESQRACIDVVLVSPRNPLNIGAVARAMANFGFGQLCVVAPFEPHWREARSAIGAPELLQGARETISLADAVKHCTMVLGTGTVTHRKPEQPVTLLDAVAPLVTGELEKGGRIAFVFGPEKHGLTREDLSFCHTLVQIPTDPQQPSMNLGQAAAVCLYELARRASSAGGSTAGDPDVKAGVAGKDHSAPTSGNLEQLAGVIGEVMVAAGYSPKSMLAANQHDLRLMLRRLQLGAADRRRALGLFRRILWRLRTPKRNVTF